MFDVPALKQIGRLQVAVQENPKAVRSVIMLHGYGANAYDLWSLQHELAVGEPLNWYFPDGLLNIELAPGYSGRAWFALNQKALERAMLTGVPLDFSQIYPPGLDRARDQILDLIRHLGLEPKDLILGGFSQGAMLSLETTLHLLQPCRGLLLFSGTLANKQEWIKQAEALGSFKFFQSHGLNDTVLPFSGAVHLRETLEQAGWTSDWYEFQGGHEIPRGVLKAASYYLKKL